MREKFRQFMAGRYGIDALNQFLSVASIVLLLLAWITRIGLFSWLGLALLILYYYRCFSRDISRRTDENYKFYRFCQSHDIRGWFTSRSSLYRDMWDHRRTHRYFKCPRCHRRLRVPRGRGRIEITCPRCSTRFIKKS